MPPVIHPPMRHVREHVLRELTTGPLTVLELHDRLSDVVPRHDRYLIQGALRTFEKRDLAQGLQAPGGRTKLWWLTEGGYGARREAVA
jgi:hypothetical protein